MTDRNVVVRLRAEIADFKGKFEQAGRAAKDLASRVEGAQASVDRIGSASTRGGVALAAGLGFAAKAAIDWESAWAGVTKTVDGSETQLAALEGQLRQMARTLPASHTEIAAVAEAAGQLGVQTDNVAAFTKVMIDLGETTNLTADEAATSLAQFMNIMGTSQDRVANLGSALVALGNNGASTERDIMAMSMRIAAAGKTAGMSESDVLAFAAALSDVGVEAEAGGTAISMSFAQIGDAVRKGGASLDLIARTAGVSSQAFQQAWGNDAAGATQAFIEGLGRMQTEGGDAKGVLDELGMTGIRQSDSLMRLALAGDKLGEHLGNSAIAIQTTSALLEEAEKRYKTTESQIRIAWNSIKDAAIEGGAVMLPVIADLASGVASMATSFGSLPAPVKAGVSGFAALAAGGLLAVGGLSKMLSTGLELRSSISELAKVSPRAASTISTVGKVAGVASVGMLALSVAAAAVQANVARTLPTVEDLKTGLSRLSNGAGSLSDLDSNFAGLEGRAGSLSEALAYLSARQEGSISGWTRFGDTIDGISSGLIGAKSDLQGVDEAFGRIDAALAQMPAAEAADVFAQLATEAQASGVSLDTLAGRLPQYTAALQQQADAAGESVTSTEALAAASLGAADAAETHTASLAELASMALQVSGTQMGLEAAIDDATAAAKENGKTLDINTEAGRANRSALDDIAAAALTLTAAQEKNSESTDTMNESTARAREAFVRTARQMGMTKDEAEALADKYGLIPKSVTTKVTATGISSAKAQADALYAKLKLLNGYTARTTVSQTITGPRRAVADGGMFESSAGFGLLQSYADGGLRPRYAGSIGDRTNGIYPYAGRAGIVMNEEGSGPWESIISGNPAKRSRSRAIAGETVRRLGGEVSWLTAFADGGVWTSPAGSGAPDWAAGLSRTPAAAGPTITMPIQISERFDVDEASRRMAWNLQ